MKLLQFSIIVCVLFLSQAKAFPQFNLKAANGFSKRSIVIPADCPHSRQHAFVPPNFAAGDQRGPCPGLNALANHGYIPHSGIVDVATVTNAVENVYNMGTDLGGFLAIYSAVVDGNAFALSPSFSIGGPVVGSQILVGTGLISPATGLSGSHNNQEADTSPTRGDLYVAGNDYLLQVPQFQEYYNALPENTPAPDQYQALFPFRSARFNQSVATNPNFFFPPFAGVLVSPAGYAFPARMMANHSAQYPDGYLDKETFKSFFAISGASGSFTYKPGYERIPDNWYKRPAAEPYTSPAYIADVLDFGAQNPRLLSVGGNTGTPNSFTGIDISALTKGVFDSATLAEGDNLACFVYQNIQASAPGFLTSLYTDVTKAVQPLFQSIDSLLAGLSCPQLNGIDNSQYSRLPGYSKAKGV